MIFMKYDYDTRILRREDPFLLLFLHFEGSFGFEPSAAIERIALSDSMPSCAVHRLVIQRHERPEVHESRIYLTSRYSRVLEVLLDEDFFLFGELLETSTMIVPREYLVEIRIERENALVVDKSLDGCGRIRSDSWQFHEMISIVREYPVIFIHNHLCGFEHIAGTGIVSESLIVREECLIGSSSE